MSFESTTPPAEQPKKPRAVIGFGRLTMGGKQKIETAPTMAVSAEAMQDMADQAVPSSRRETGGAVTQAEEEILKENIESAKKELEASRAAKRAAEFKKMEEEAAKTDSAYIASLREKMGLHDTTLRDTARKQHLVVSPEELQQIQKEGERAEFNWALDDARRGKMTYGGELEQPIEAVASRRSETSFHGFEEERESNPAMFSLAEMERQEEEAQKKKKPGERAA